MQKIQNGSDWRVVADFHLKNSAINKKLFDKSKHLQMNLSKNYFLKAKLNN